VLLVVNIFLSGGPVMYPLLLCSVLVLFVVVERFIFWAGIDLRRDRNLLDEVLELCRQGKWRWCGRRSGAARTM
jgi:biopolymer transport protein ExbB